MADEKDEEIADKELEKATGGTDPRLVIKKTNVLQPGSAGPVYLDDPDNPTPTRQAPRTRPGDQISPV
jgi:hypothetical protein